ncbi:MAG: hypothetical protein JWO38_4494 [Gemmataceae bacterium]|nr:hypothetical protein [Gemmataceae bacterium]
MSRDPDKMNHPPPGPGTPDPLAESLARLEPSPAALNRDRLMFRAGAESRRTVVRLWQLTAGLMAAVGFFAGMYYRSPATIERVVYVDHHPASATTIPPRSPGEGQPAPLPGAVAPIAPPISAPETPSPAREYPPATIHAEPGGDVVEWLQIRNAVLTGGLGFLPDPGRQPSPAHIGLDQPGSLPRGVDIAPK